MRLLWYLIIHTELDLKIAEKKMKLLTKQYLQFLRKLQANIQQQ